MTTILLADDKRSIREFCKQELEDEGYLVILARDGREALERVQEEPPDLVILDLRMPRVGGLDAIEPIRAIASEVPIILYTANDEDCVTDGRSRHAVACVEKSEEVAALSFSMTAVSKDREPSTRGSSLACGGRRRRYTS